MFFFVGKYIKKKILDLLRIVNETLRIVNGEWKFDGF